MSSRVKALLLSAPREKAKEHKHNNDDEDDPEDSADRKEHSERCKHSRLLVGVSVNSLLVGLRNGSALTAQPLLEVSSCLFE